MKEQNKMKKLMIAAAIVCAATMSQAASFKWMTSANAYSVPATTTLVDGQKYDAGTTSMKSAASTWAWTAVMVLSDGSSSETINIDTISYNINKISTTGIESTLFELPTEDGVTKTYSWEITITGTDKDGNTLTSDPIVGSQGYTKSSNLQISSATPAKWLYTAAPEPTSGLLLLIGVGALALRRRRA